jgi:hypothetical protein
MVNWGDVPTWVTAGVALLALIGAGIAYKYQAEQVRLQREQLADQKEASRQQSRVIAEQNRLRQREQADQVEFSWQPSAPLDETQQDEIWMGVVRNASQRPVRDVVCRIHPHPAEDFEFGAQGVGQLMNIGMDTRANVPTFASPRLGDMVPLIRRDAACGFKTSITVHDHGVARMMVRFTDDAGLHWEIDPDLHLKKLDHRDW